MWEADDVRLAATLVALGFPGERSHYADARPAALERWRSEPAFRRLAGALADGLGLELIDVTPPGDVILVAQENTPFTPLTETLWPRTVTADASRRQLGVLALLGVVAEVFPTEDALASGDEGREVAPAEVVQLLLSRAEAVAREPLPAEPTPREEELRRAFEVVRERQPSAPTKTGREGALGLEGTVTHVLRLLATHGLVREVGAGERLGFRPTAAFAPHVRHLLAREDLDQALGGLRAARERQQAGLARNGG